MTTVRCTRNLPGAYGPVGATRKGIPLERVEAIVETEIETVEVEAP